MVCTYILNEYYNAAESVIAKLDRHNAYEWNIGPLDKVYMTLENTVHYQLNSVIGDIEAEAILPPGGIYVHLGKDFEQKRSLSLFHQIQCLNTIRMQIVTSYAETHPALSDNQEVDPSAQDCMDYLRQMVLCRADLRLESARNAHGPRIAVSDITHTCKDWTRVYDEAEKNYRGYLQYFDRGVSSTG